MPLFCENKWTATVPLFRLAYLQSKYGRKSYKSRTPQRQTEWVAAVENAFAICCHVSDLAYQFREIYEQS